MPEDLFKESPHDNERIDPKDESALSYWSEQWRVPKPELRHAIEKVGPKVADVRRHLVGGFTPAGPTS